MERKEAQLLGLNKFNTGRPCVHGHLTFRYTSTGSCNECLNGVRNVNKPENFMEMARNLQSAATRTYNDGIKQLTENYDRAMDKAKEYEQAASTLKLQQDEELQLKNQKLFEFHAQKERKQAVNEMIKLKVFIHPDDVFEAKTYLLERAQSVCPHITADDVNYKRKVQGGVLHEIRCFAQHKEEIIEATTKAYNARTTPQS